MAYALVVIGSGVAGLTTAHIAVEANLKTLVIDKGRRSGGRLSTRAALPFHFNHGAQKFTVTGLSFNGFCGVAEQEGVLRELKIKEQQTTFTGNPDMHELAKLMGKGLKIKQSIKIACYRLKVANCMYITKKIHIGSTKIPK